ncbi:hypothetical protein GCM10027286_15260 [Virgibacillus ainsalahensis]
MMINKKRINEMRMILGKKTHAGELCSQNLTAAYPIMIVKVEIKRYTGFGSLTSKRVAPNTTTINVSERE